jgi:microcystin-dependent protein
MSFPDFVPGEVLTAGDMDSIVSFLSPTGSVTAFAGSTAPTNWLLCNGTTVSRTTYAALFAVCGTQFNTGGEAGTDFRLPNLLGRVPVGLDAGQAEFDTRGETGGAKTHTLTTAEMPSHAHEIQRNNQAATSVGADASGLYQSVANTGASYANTQTNGGGAAHNNLQPYIVLNYIIKT